MSTRTTLRPQKVIVNGDMSANITSNVTVLQSLSIVSFTVSWTGATPVGALAVQVSDTYSLNPDGSVKNTGDWVAVYVSQGGSLVNSINISGNSGTGYIDVGPTAAYAIRLVYTAGTGTGTLQATVNGKTT